MSRTKQGLFIAIDGPKNAGKTTLLQLVQSYLLESGPSVLFTKEPTARFQLSNEQTYTGIDLAYLIAQDRQHHLEAIVLPGLALHHAIVSDRYIASSLAFQGMDGIHSDRIWELNQGFPLPDLNIFLMADVASLMRRRQERDHHTRLEVVDPRLETMFYDRARIRMEERGVATVIIDNSDSRKEFEVAQTTAKLIEAVIKDQHD